MFKRWKKEERAVPPHLPKEVRQKGQSGLQWFTPFSRLVLMAAVFGLLSGIVGGMLIDSGLLDRWVRPFGLEYGGQSDVSRGERRNLAREALAEKSRKALAVFFRAGAMPAKNLPLAERLPRPDQQLGFGVFLTADGWIATSQAALAGLGKKDVVALSSERRFYVVENILKDPASDLALVKIAEGNFSVLPFVFDDYLGAGTTLWLPTPETGVRPTELLNTNYFSPKHKDDFYQSSEKIYRFGLLKDDFPAGQTGLPVLTAQAEVAGLLISSSSFLPSSVLASALKSVLKEKSIKRPYLGVHFIESAWLVPPNASSDRSIVREEKKIAGDASRGVILLNDGLRQLLAIEKKSPLWHFGLKSGDAIISIGQDQITASRSLPQILLDYGPGARVEIKYKQDGEEKTNLVELGTIK